MCLCAFPSPDSFKIIRHQPQIQAPRVNIPQRPRFDKSIPASILPKSLALKSKVGEQQYPALYNTLSLALSLLVKTPRTTLELLPPLILPNSPSTHPFVLRQENLYVLVCSILQYTAIRLCFYAHYFRTILCL